MTLIITKKNDHCRFWHNGFATRWNISVQRDLFNETSKLLFFWLLQCFH